MKHDEFAARLIFGVLLGFTIGVIAYAWGETTQWSVIWGALGGFVFFVKQ